VRFRLIAELPLEVVFKSVTDPPDSCSLTQMGYVYPSETCERPTMRNDLNGADTIPARILFEPVVSGARCAAIDENGNTLWGFVASKHDFRKVHQLVAIYDELSDQIAARLVKYGKMEAKKDEPNLAEIRELIDRATKLLSKLRTSFASENPDAGRADKADRVIALRGAIQDLVTTIELLEKGNRTAKSDLADELPLE